MKIAQRRKFFFWRNALTKLSIKRTRNGPVMSIRIRSGGHEFPDMEFTSTSSRGRAEFEMRKSLLGRYFWGASFGLTPSHFTTTVMGQLLSLQRPCQIAIEGGKQMSTYSTALAVLLCRVWSWSKKSKSTTSSLKGRLLSPSGRQAFSRS